MGPLYYTVSGDLRGCLNLSQEARFTCIPNEKFNLGGLFEGHHDSSFYRLARLAIFLNHEDEWTVSPSFPRISQHCNTSLLHLGRLSPEGVLASLLPSIPPFHLRVFFSTTPVLPLPPCQHDPLIFISCFTFSVVPSIQHAPLRTPLDPSSRLLPPSLPPSTSLPSHPPVYRLPTNTIMASRHWTSLGYSYLCMPGLLEGVHQRRMCRFFNTCPYIHRF